VLADTSFYDPSRAARSRLSRLPALERRDGPPAGVRRARRLSRGNRRSFSDYRHWFDHYVRGVDNGVDREPVVELLVGNGSPETVDRGDFTRIDAADWPVPGIAGNACFRSRTRRRGELDQRRDVAGRRAKHAGRSGLSVDHVATDGHRSHTTGTSPASGGQALFDAIPVLRQLALVEPLALTYTTPALTDSVEVVGPASLDVFVAALTPEADLFAVLADVWPDGSPMPWASDDCARASERDSRAFAHRRERRRSFQAYGDYATKSGWGIRTDARVPRRVSGRSATASKPVTDCRLYLVARRATCCRCPG